MKTVFASWLQQATLIPSYLSWGRLSKKIFLAERIFYIYFFIIKILSQKKFFHLQSPPDDRREGMRVCLALGSIQKDSLSSLKRNVFPVVAAKKDFPEARIVPMASQSSKNINFSI
jgi:hypothetical protein